MFCPGAVTAYTRHKDLQFHRKSELNPSLGVYPERGSLGRPIGDAC